MLPSVLRVRTAKQFADFFVIKGTVGTSLDRPESGMVGKALVHCKFFSLQITGFVLTNPSWDWDCVNYSQRLASDIPAGDGNTAEPFFTVW